MFLLLSFLQPQELLHFPKFQPKCCCGHLHYGPSGMCDCQVCMYQLMALIITLPFFFYYSGFGITIGVHQLWSRHLYKAYFFIQLYLISCNSITNQGSIYHLACDHHVNHTDPKNTTCKFLFVHMGWLVIKKDPDMINAGHEMDFPDLTEDPMVVFQKKTDLWFDLCICPMWPCVHGEKTFGWAF